MRTVTSDYDSRREATFGYNKQLSYPPSEVRDRRLNRTAPEASLARSATTRRVVEFAQLYLHAEAAGLPRGELAVALAEAVSRLPEVKLAQEVLAGGNDARWASGDLAEEEPARPSGGAIPEAQDRYEIKAVQNRST